MEPILEEARGNSKSIHACKRKIYGSQVVNIWAKLHIIYLIICVFLRDGDGERERDLCVSICGELSFEEIPIWVGFAWQGELGF